MSKAIERAEAKRERILRAATTTFRRHGHARTSLDLIAQEAGMSRPAIYNFFDGKDALFTATVLFMGEEVVTRLRDGALALAGVRERLTFVCRDWAAGGYDRMQQNPDAKDLTDPSHPAVRQVYRMVEDLLTEIIADGRPGEEASSNAGALARLLVASMTGFKELASGRDELEALLGLQIDLVMRAVKAAP